MREKRRGLELARERVQHEVDEAIKSAEDIEEDVRRWIEEASRVAWEVQSLEREIDVNMARRCLNLRWCFPDCRWRYVLGKRASKTAPALAELLGGRATFVRISRPRPPAGIERHCSENFKAFEATKSAFDQIMEALVDEGINVVGVYGMGGVGKTTLVTEVGRKGMEWKMFDYVAMARVSQSRDVMKMQGEIGDMLGVKFGEESEYGRAQRLIDRLQNESSRNLIILDDVWESFKLEDLGIPSSGAKGCKIIITTRRRKVCTHMGCESLVAVNILSKQDAWALFKKASGASDDGTWPPDLTDVAMKVSEECKGLPLAIVVLGKALKGKNLRLWKTALDRLHMSRLPYDIDEGNSGIYAVLRLSYDFLKDGETRKCFLLCSLFPEDHRIDVEDLVRYAFGQGLFTDGVDSVDGVRNQVHSIMDSLKDSSMLLDSNDEHHVKMHDVVRDVALWIASEGENVHFVRTNASLKGWPRMKSCQHYTAISLIGNDLRELPNDLECPELQIFLLGMNRRLLLANFTSEGLKALLVLDLSRTTFSMKYKTTKFHQKSLQPLVLSSLQSLSSLRTLNLRSCSVLDVPVLGSLKKLEILDLSYCPIEVLPDEIGELSSLKLLDLSGCQQLRRISSNVISRLSLLEELYMGATGFAGWVKEGSSTDSEKQSNASLSELTSLPHLAIVSLSFHDTKFFPKDFHFPRLSRYCIFTGFPLETLYPTSKSLFISCDKNEPLPIAFKELLPEVEHLNVNCCSLPNVIPMMNPSGSDKLITLDVKYCSGMNYLVDTLQWSDRSAFSKLVELGLESMPDLKAMCPEKFLPPRGFFKDLQTMLVVRCQQLQNIAQNNTVQLLLHLKVLRVEGCDRMQEIFQVQVEGLHHPAYIIQGEGAVLSKLRDLTLVRLPELGCIWRGPSHGVSFRSLTSLTVTRCPKMTTVFTPWLAHSLLQLECLKIQHCGELEHIVLERDDDEAGEVQTFAPGVHRQRPVICFPKLQILRIWDCQKLKSLFPIIAAAPDSQQLHEADVIKSGGVEQILIDDNDGGELAKVKINESFCLENHHILRCVSLQKLKVGNFPSMATAVKAILNAQPKELRVFSVQGSHDLLTIVPARMVGSNLEEVTVENCGCVREVFELEGLETGPSLLSSSVKKLVLKSLPELRYIWRGLQELARFESLKSMELYECNALKFVFSPAVARTLVQLDSIKICGCGRLEQVIAINSISKNDQIGPLHVNHQLQPLFFPKLRILEVTECHGLRSLFPMEIARGLQRLEFLSVCDASRIVKIFGQEEEEEEDDDDDDEEERESIVLPILNFLSLRDLPKLKNLCPPSHKFEGPSLQFLTITKCPELTTTLSLEGRSEGSVDRGERGGVRTF